MKHLTGVLITYLMHYFQWLYRIGANWLRKTLLFGDAYMYITYQVMFSKEMACNVLNPQPEPKLKLDRVLLMGLTQT